MPMHVLFVAPSNLEPYLLACRVLAFLLSPATKSPMLPSYANRDGRLQVAPRGTVFLNAVQDQVHMETCRRNVRSRPDKVYHDGRGLTGTNSGQQYKAYEAEVVAVLKGSATMSNIQRFGGSRPGFRGGVVQETRVPVVFNANGIVGETAWEVDKKISILGFSNLVGRDNNTHDMNVQIGGTLSVCINGPERWCVGDYIIARTPTKDEANLLQARSGNLANRKGRVPFMLCPLRPETVDVYNREAVADAFKTKITFNSDESDGFKPNEAVIKDQPFYMRLFVEGLCDMGNAFLSAAYLGASDKSTYQNAAKKIAKALRDPTSSFMTQVMFRFSKATMRLLLDLSSRLVGRSLLAGESGHDADVCTGAYCR